MDDLFAMEDLSQLEDEEQINTTQNIVLTESRSYEDPVLLKDDRVLANILDRQLNNNNNTEGYFKTVQTEIKPHMRKIVSDWMLQVTEEQQCQSEVFSLAINYMDRFLSRVNIRKNQFQLLASVCMFLASKFKETAPLPAENLVIYTDNSITTLEITVSNHLLPICLQDPYHIVYLFLLFLTAMGTARFGSSQLGFIRRDSVQHFGSFAQEHGAGLGLFHRQETCGDIFGFGRDGTLILPHESGHDRGRLFGLGAPRPQVQRRRWDHGQGATAHSSRKSKLACNIHLIQMIAFH